MLTASDTRVAHVLFLEDGLGISSVIRSHLEKYPDIALEKVQTPEAAISRIRSPEFDTIILSLDNPHLERVASSLGVNCVSIRNHGKILPLHLCSYLSNDRIIVEDKDSVVEFSLHRRRNVRKQILEIIAYIHNLVVIRSGINYFESDKWLLSDVVEASKLAIAVINGNAFQWCNDQTSEMLGYSSNEIGNMKFSDLFSSREVYVQCSRDLQKSRDRSGWGRAEAVLCKKDGGSVTCAVCMRRIDPLRPMKGHIISLQDLNADKKNEQHIRELLARIRTNEAQFREALDNVNAIVVRTDPEGTILFSNQNTLSRLGYEPSELLGKNIFGSIFPEDSRFGKEMLALTGTTITPVSTATHACEVTMKSGNRTWVAWNTIALPGPVNDSEEVLFIGCDITDREAGPTQEIRTTPWKYQLLRDTGVSEEVFDAVFHICVELSVEGRENKHVGTAFTIGDSKQVLAFSRQCGINAYEGQGKSVRCIKDPGNREAIKGLAQMDGAFVVREDGIIEASCRHFIIDSRDIPIPVGYGTRHSSMAGITRMTKTIGIVVSESGGTISVFRDGIIVRKFSL